MGDLQWSSPTDTDRAVLTDCDDDAVETRAVGRGDREAFVQNCPLLRKGDDDAAQGALQNGAMSRRIPQDRGAIVPRVSRWLLQLAACYRVSLRCRG